MQDKNMLEDHPPLHNNSNIMLVMRLHGGSDRSIDPSLPRSNDRCFVTFESFKESGTIVLKMPCKHSISSDGLMEYAWSEVSTNKKAEIRCSMCNAEWSLDVITRYGGATATELKQLEVGMSQNVCFKSSDINQCPKCQSYCMRQDTTNNAVRCIICSKKQDQGGYDFCWQCLRSWKSPLSSDHCGNSSCNNSAKLDQLRKCGKVMLEYINVETFKMRACPKCGTVIELSDGCKHMECILCKTEFCFLCLRMKSQGSWQCGNYDSKCVPAPLQTFIPHQK